MAFFIQEVYAPPSTSGLLDTQGRTLRALSSVASQLPRILKQANVYERARVSFSGKIHAKPLRLANPLFASFVGRSAPPHNRSRALLHTPASWQLAPALRPA